jgi:hypothetical protein
LKSHLCVILERTQSLEFLTRRRTSTGVKYCLKFEGPNAMSDKFSDEEPMMEDSEGYDYGDGSDYGGSDDGMGSYDYGDGSSPIAHLRKVI